MIVDAFSYFNERELVQLRIKYLSELIDKFVVIEADYTHQGKKKDWNFEGLLNNELKSFKEKIVYHKLKIDLDHVSKLDGWRSSSEKGGLGFKMDNFQRNYLQTACKDYSMEDVILMSDLDEIPSKNKVKFIMTCNLNEIAPVAFEQNLFHLNCKFLNLERWIGTIAFTKKYIDKFKPQEFRNARYKISCLINAGWSFSSFGNNERINEKFNAFAHDEYNLDKYKEENHIEKCKELGVDLFHRNIKKKKISKDFFPKDLLLLMEENSNFYFG